MLFLETLRKTLLLLIIIVNWPYFIIVVSQEEMGMADQWSSQNTHLSIKFTVLLWVWFKAIIVGTSKVLTDHRSS